MLYHFSEESTIQRFVPRAPLAHPEVEPMVWTIHQDYEQMFWLPRDCPRMCFWPTADTTLHDRERLWSGVTGHMVVAIEAAWLHRLQTTQLFRYHMPPATFVPNGDFGYYVSRHTLEPLAVEPLGNLLDRLVASVELRFCPSLTPLGEALITSSLSWHLIRMRNAVGWTH